jgi:hypothetical protein
MTQPTIVNVSAPADGTYRTGQNLDFTFTFDQVVYVASGAVPTVSVDLDSGSFSASYISGSGSDTLVFRYTIQSGDLDADGLNIVAPGMISTGAGIQNAGLEDIDPSFTPPPLAGVLVDAVAPQVSSVTVPADGTYNAGQNLDFTVDFDQAVTVDTTGGTPRVALTLATGGTVYADYVSGSGTAALVFRHTVGSGEEDADGITVGALSANGGTLKDAAGNDATLTLNSVGATSGVLVDGVADLSVAATSASIPEGSGGGTTAFTFTVTRGDDTTGAASVDYAVTGSGGSAADAADFSGALPSGTVNFAAGETTQVVTINVAADGSVESDEGFTVTLSNATGGAIGTATAAGSIVNDDAAPPAEPPVTSGSSGPDSMDGAAGADSLAAGDGGDNLRGFAGADSVDGGLGADTVNGNMGSDTVTGGDGQDVVFGGKDSDRVDGGAGDDLHVNGNIGVDTVHGGDGADTAYGGKDNDSVYGDAGDDHVSGDLGDDNLFGGAGADHFGFAPGFGHDWVIDFNFAEGDRILLPTGTAYTTATFEGQTLIILDGGQDVIGLAGVSGFSADWIAFA